MKAILLISEVKEHDGNYSVAWKCGDRSGFYTAPNVELLSSQLGGLFVSLLGAVESPEEIEEITAEPASPAEEVAVELAETLDQALSEWDDFTDITPSPRSCSPES